MKLSESPECISRDLTLLEALWGPCTMYLAKEAERALRINAIRWNRKQCNCYGRQFRQPDSGALTELLEIIVASVIPSPCPSRSTTALFSRAEICCVI